jgi:hypothetical protein
LIFSTIRFSLRSQRRKVEALRKRRKLKEGRLMVTKMILKMRREI